MKQFFGATLVVVLFIVANAAHGDISPPKTPKNFYSEPPSSHNMLSAGVHLGYLHILFEQTTLASVIHEAGEGKIGHVGDAGESIYWVCYTVTTHARGRIWLIAHGEMGGPEHRIGLVDAKYDERASPTSDCPALPVKLGEFSFDGNIVLGMSDSAAIDTLGPIYKRQNSWTHYQYVGEIPGGCSPDSADIVNHISFESSNGIVRWIVAGQTTTC